MRPCRTRPTTERRHHRILVNRSQRQHPPGIAPTRSCLEGALGKCGTTQEILAFRDAQRALGRDAVLLSRLGSPTRGSEQVGADGVHAVVTGEAGVGSGRLKERQAGGGPIDPRQGDRSISVTTGSRRVRGETASASRRRMLQ